MRTLSFFFNPLPLLCHPSPQIEMLPLSYHTQRHLFGFLSCFLDTSLQIILSPCKQNPDIHTGCVQPADSCIQLCLHSTWKYLLQALGVIHIHTHIWGLALKSLLYLHTQTQIKQRTAVLSHTHTHTYRLTHINAATSQILEVFMSIKWQHVNRVSRQSAKWGWGCNLHWETWKHKQGQQVIIFWETVSTLQHWLPGKIWCNPIFFALIRSILIGAINWKEVSEHNSHSTDWSQAASPWN